MMLLPSSALADVVTLKGGEKITGIARVVEDEVIVDLGYGTVSVDRDEVLRIRKSDSALGQLYRRRQALRLASLGRWPRVRRTAFSATFFGTKSELSRAMLRSGDAPE